MNLPKFFSRTHPLRKKLTLYTLNAAIINRRLCKHFQHKVEVTWDQNKALIQFEEGVCILQVGAEELNMCCEAGNSGDMKAITDTMDRHISGLWRKESFTFNWANAY